MGDSSTQPRPPTLTELVALAEAAGEGPEGIRAVLEVIRNRSLARKMSMDQIVSQPHQFSGFDRPDLLEFYNQQPEPLRKEVSGMIAEMEAELKSIHSKGPALTQRGTGSAPGDNKRPFSSAIAEAFGQ